MARATNGTADVPTNGVAGFSAVTPLIKETCLYVADLERAATFYTGLFGFDRLDGDARFCALNVGGRQVLLLFRRGASNAPMPLPGGGGTIPPHDGSGSAHLGFSIAKNEVVAWEEKLRERGLAVESRVAWPRGGTSLFFRDPDGHLLELLTPGVWSIY